METNTTAKEHARRLFFQSNLTQKQIAEIAGINPRTMFDWINQGDWKRAKDMVLNAPTFLAEQYYNQLSALNNNIAQRKDTPYPTKDEAGIMRTVTATLKTIKTKQTRSELVEILTDFSAFAGANTPAIADPLQRIITAYLQALSGTGPAERLARLTEPQQAADAHQAHIMEMLADAESLPPIDDNADNKTISREQEQHEKLLLAAGSAEPIDDTTPEIPSVYGVKWIDFLANQGTSPIQLLKKLPRQERYSWMDKFLTPDADHFLLVKKIKEEQITPHFFNIRIPAQNRFASLLEAICIYEDDLDTATPGNPVPTTQYIENQHQHDPLIEKYFPKPIN